MKVQKNSLDEFKIFDNKVTSISHLAKIGVLNKNSDLYRQKCMDSSYFPFSIALALSKGSGHQNLSGSDNSMASSSSSTLKSKNGIDSKSG
jgi:hypothetical protein|tara:strand:+ start:64 stop:336 length:273 start_codon:yes stop_codon:yes gene_type:complete